MTATIKSVFRNRIVPILIRAMIFGLFVILGRLWMTGFVGLATSIEG